MRSWSGPTSCGQHFRITQNMRQSDFQNWDAGLVGLVGSLPHMSACWMIRLTYDHEMHSNNKESLNVAEGKVHV